MKQALPGKIRGSLQAPSSKSMAQRAVAAAAMAEGISEIRNYPDCDDALAAIECARALGAGVSSANGKLIVAGNGKPDGSELHCGESGLCLRMFTPIAALSDTQTVITGKGSLLSRPVGMAQQPLEALGASCETNRGKPPITVIGPIHGGKLEVDGSASSQFITGLLMALPLCRENSVISVSNPKSKPYLRMTVSLLEKFGVNVECNASMDKFVIKGGQKYKPTAHTVEGDWSAAAFLLVAGAIAGKVRVRGLGMDSLQADRAIVDALKLAGAKVRVNEDCVGAEKAELKCFEFDATDCPDLFPPLVALACNCRGKSRISGALRLKGKESDRSAVLVSEFAKIGGKVSISNGGDVMEIEGCALSGGKADSHNDHRIAMALAIAALNSQKGVSIEGAECVSKSYPKFFEDLEALQEGGRSMDPFSFGNNFRITAFGSSHGPHVGVEIEGCPAGVEVGEADVQMWLDRRKPGASPLASARKEEDRVIVESGIENGKTTGGKMRMIVKNTDTKSKDYEKFGEVPRPGHADYPSIAKYGSAQAGGGFFSGRMTAAFVMAGAVAKKLLEARGVQTLAFSRQIGKVRDEKGTKDADVRKNVYQNAVRAADLSLAEAMQKEIESAKAEGDSVGGVVECRVIGLPAGKGEPMFLSIEGRLSQAMFAIPAVKGVEFGAGFAAAGMLGSQNNDQFVASGGKIGTKTNNAGGILGGLSTGMPVVFRVAFKPTSSIFKPQATANLKTMKEEKLVIAGRHDPCIAIRAVPVVECVAAVCAADLMLAEGEAKGE
ncbi:MAG: chorismate synthase [Candidatus Micrarchaeia archaeon]